MQLEDYFEFVEPDHIRIKGHRIAIESILRRYLAGQQVEEIVREYDTLRGLPRSSPPSPTIWNTATTSTPISSG